MEDGIKFSFEDEPRVGARIKVVGVGGGGSNAINRMISVGMEGVDFLVVNTDVQALRHSNAPVKLQIGAKLTRGLGAGANPDTGRKAALEDTDKLIEHLEGADMVFVTAGLGGGTGTGAAPIVASLATELGALTVAVVTKPFPFEGKRRMQQAEQGLAELVEAVDTVITIPNERLLSLERGISCFEAFRIADDILRQAVQGISDIITIPGIINRDFADVKAVMQGMGYALMGTAVASGENRAVEAARRAISSPLLEDTSIEGARGILINITGSSNLKLHEVHEPSTIIHDAAHEDANIIFGAVMNEEMGDSVKITVIATGFRSEAVGSTRRQAAAKNAEPVIHLGEAQPKPGVGQASTPALTHMAKERQTGTPASPPEPAKAAAAAASDAAPAPTEPPQPEEETLHEPARTMPAGFAADDYDIPTYLRRKKE